MKTHIITILLIFLGLQVSAQSFLQKGEVVGEDGEPIIGASVIEKGTTNGTVTDIDGKFSITISNKSTLVVSFIGMVTQEYKVDSAKAFVKIVLKDDSPVLEDVVVIGYGTESRSSMTGSTSSVRVRGSSSKASKPKAAKVDKSKVGLLTAGELSDFSKWMMWDSIANKVFPSYKLQWKIQPLERYVAQLTNPAGMPIVNAKVILADKSNKAIWEARTDNTGRAELWANIYPQEQPQSAATIYFEYEEKDTTIVAKPFSEGINTVSLPVVCNETQKVDIMMIVDATGSMGDEIKYLQNELHDIILKVKEKQSDLDVRIGSVFYRDIGDEYVTRKTPLSSDITETINFIQAQSANGGGDYPEAVDEALYQAIELENWSKNALTRIAFLVLDAPAHNKAENIARIQDQVKLAAEKGIRIIPLVCSGINKEGEYLMRSIALATNGTYVFLTDDSGIGDAHIKPSTDKYDVESLNDLMIRLIMQYTKMPDCDNNSWEKEYQKEQVTDKFVPNPYDQNPEKKADKLNNKDVMKVYPNPCSSVLKIDIKENIKDLYIVDISGKSLMNFNPLKDETLEVDISMFSAGVYFVKTYYKGRWFTEKVIKR